MEIEKKAAERVGISYLGVEAPYTTFSAEELGKAIEQDPDKIKKGLGIRSMKWPAYSQNNSTMAAQALYAFIQKLEKDPELKKKFFEEPPRRIFYATESNSDQSRPDAMSAIRMVCNELMSESSDNRRYVNVLRGCDVMQVTFACAGAGLSLGNAFDHVKANDKSSAIIISADTSVYDNARAPNAEATQGSAATIMWVTRNPKLVALNGDTISGTANLPVSDFTKFGDHRPLVHGKFSEIMYIYLAAQAFESVEDHYAERTGHTILDDTQFMVTHVPFPKQALYYNSALFAHYIKLNGNKALKDAVAPQSDPANNLMNSVRFTNIVSEIIEKNRGLPEVEFEHAVRSNELLQEYMNWLRSLRAKPETELFAKSLHIAESLMIPSVTGNSYSSAAVVGLASTLSNADLETLHRGLVVFYGSGAISKVIPLDIVARELEKNRYMNINVGVGDEVVYLTAEHYKEMHEMLLMGEAKRVMSDVDLYEKDCKLLGGSDKVPPGFHVNRYNRDGTSDAFYLRR